MEILLLTRQQFCCGTSPSSNIAAPTQKHRRTQRCSAPRRYAGTGSSTSDTVTTWSGRSPPSSSSLFCRRGASCSSSSSSSSSLSLAFFCLRGVGWWFVSAKAMATVIRSWRSRHRLAAPVSCSPCNDMPTTTSTSKIHQRASNLSGLGLWLWLLWWLY